MKYELTDIKRDYNGTTVYRIRALEDIENKLDFQLDVKKGDLGGWVSGYHNLSQQGKCWIEEPNTDLDESKSCAEGLHFSSPNYWIKNKNVFKKQLVLKAKIKLDDIVSIQNGKIRCKRAEILGYFEV